MVLWRTTLLYATLHAALGRVKAGGSIAMTARTRTLRIETRVVGGQTVAAVRGTVDLSTSPQLRDALLDVAARTTGPLYVDLSQVPYMDSSGVGTLVYAKRECDRSGRSVVLIGLPARVRSVLEITHLDRFFRIVNTADEALQQGDSGEATAT